MVLADEMRKALKGSAAIVPQYVTIGDWRTLTGIGRSKTYEMLADGVLQAIKVGRSLRIHVPSGLAALEAMPRADVRVATRPRKDAA